MMASNAGSSDTYFRNVDLDLYLMHDLQPLVHSFGKKVHVLYLGRDKRTFCAHLELAKDAKSPDSTIRAFCTLVRALPGRSETSALEYRQGPNRIPAILRLRQQR